MTAICATPQFLVAEYQRAAELYQPALRLLDGARILLTGGTGPFGQWILGVAKAAHDLFGIRIGFDLVTRDAQALRFRFSGLLQAMDVRLIEGDVRQVDFSQSGAPLIIHGAAPSARETFEGKSSLDKFDALYLGTRRIAEHATTIKAQKLLFVSSGAAYGSQGSGGFAEDGCYQIATDLRDGGLMQGKRAAEFIAFETCRQAGIECVAARCFSFVGAGMPYDLHYAVGEFTFKAIKQEPIVIQSDGTALRSFMHLRDLSGWLLTLLAQHTQHAIYNVGSSYEVSILDLAQKIKKNLGSASEITCLGGPSTSVGNPTRHAYVPDISRIKHELMLPPVLPLDEALQSYAHWVAYDLKHSAVAASRTGA